MTADVVVGIEERQIELAMQEMSAAESGDSSTNDGERRTRGHGDDTVDS